MIDKVISKRTSVICSVTLLVAILCSGCGTILAHTETDRIKGAYSGVRLDAHLIPASTESSPDFPAIPWIIPFCILDMPLSATLDTVFLPYDLTQPFKTYNADFSN